MKNFILSTIISSTLCLSTFSMENYNKKTDMETAVEKLWIRIGSTTKWEDVSINKVEYRKGEVPGDNDCGVRTLDALFPGHNLTRSTILDRLMQILENPKDAHHVLLRDVLSKDFIFLLKADLSSQLYAGKPSYPQILAAFPNFVSLLNKDLFGPCDRHIQLAKENPTILKAYLNCFRDESVLFISPPNATTNSMGFLGLVCEIYKFNVQLINHTNKGEHQIFMLGRPHEPQKSMMFRSSHFSPLCLINDLEERNRFAAYYAHEVILKKINVFKDQYVPSEDLEALKRNLTQRNIVGNHTIGEQKTQTLAKSPHTNGPHKDVSPTTSNLDKLSSWEVDNLKYFIQERGYSDNSLRVHLNNINKANNFNNSEIEEIITSARTRFTLGDKKVMQSSDNQGAVHHQQKAEPKNGPNNIAPKINSINIPSLFQEVIGVSKKNEKEFGIVMTWADLIGQLSVDPDSPCFGYGKELLRHNALFG